MDDSLGPRLSGGRWPPSWWVRWREARAGQAELGQQRLGGAGVARCGRWDRPEHPKCGDHRVQGQAGPRGSLSQAKSFMFPPLPGGSPRTPVSSSQGSPNKLWAARPGPSLPSSSGSPCNWEPRVPGDPDAPPTHTSRLSPQPLSLPGHLLQPPHSATLSTHTSNSPTPYGRRDFRPTDPENEDWSRLPTRPHPPRWPLRWPVPATLLTTRLRAPVLSLGPACLHSQGALSISHTSPPPGLKLPVPPSPLG